MNILRYLLARLCVTKRLAIAKGYTVHGRIIRPPVRITLVASRLVSACNSLTASYTRTAPETTGAGIGVSTYRRMSRHNAAIFSSVGTVAPSFNGRAVRGVARPTGSCTRHANPHGFAPPDWRRGGDEDIRRTGGRNA
jgi:hypothetical protein